MPSVQPLNDHERIRRELWAAVYRQRHQANLTASYGRIEPEYRWVEEADRAVDMFDKRFDASGVEGKRNG